MTDIPPAARGPLVALIAALRPDWGKPGITKALEKLNAEEGLTTEQRITYALRAAFNSELTTPEGMNLTGKHRTNASGLDWLDKPTHVHESRCHHGERNSTCPHCRAHREQAARERVDRGEGLPDYAKAAIAQVREQLKGRKPLATTPGRVR